MGGHRRGWRSPRRRDGVVFFIASALALIQSCGWTSGCAVAAFFPVMNKPAALTSRSKSSTVMCASKPSLPPRGSAANPNGKKKVAVVGAGGYLGAILFGFLQRASSLPSTGLGDKFSSSPRAIASTAVTAKALNKVLALSFRLAFAGENMMRLTDMTQPQAIAERLQGMNAVIFGTRHDLERVKVTLNTYETTPNQETYEVYLDDCRFGAADPLDQHEQERDAFHTAHLDALLKACEEAQIQHMVILETPLTDATQQKEWSQRLSACSIPFTYIKTTSKEWVTTPVFSFEDGIQCRHLKIQSISTNTANWAADAQSSSSSMAREDIAAVAVQSLLSLPWDQSRCLVVEKGPESSNQEKPETRQSTRRRPPIRTDMEWCVNSKEIADKLSTIL